MKNCSENSPSYILFGKEALYLYHISVQHLLTATDVDYHIGVFTEVKDFVIEKNKWDDFTEIDYHEYFKIKSHLEKRPIFFRNAKNKFLLGIFN